MKNLLEGKKGLVMGVANEHSIAWGIAALAAKMGAQLCFSYQHEIFKKRITKLGQSIGVDHFYECDVSTEGSLHNLMKSIGDDFSKIDFIIHTPAFSDKNELKGPYLNTSRKNFLNAMNISCYSLTETCREALPILNDVGSIITMTYLGSQRVITNYNVMGLCKAALEASVRYLAADVGDRGIRVNAISAGPIKTLAASGVTDFNKFLEIGERSSPLKRNITQEEIAGLAAFLISDLSTGVTGGIHYVDAGYNIMGLSLGG